MHLLKHRFTYPVVRPGSARVAVRAEKRRKHRAILEVNFGKHAHR